MDIFKSTRIKLTALYLTVIMLISISFSTYVYFILSREVERFARNPRFRIENRIDPDLVNDAKRRILVNLLDINLAVLAVSGLLGYYLAGRTLRPISEMLEEQKRFVSDASHELKTPLTALKTSFEVFLRDSATDIVDARKLIKEGILDVDRLSVLTASLLELSKATEVKTGKSHEALLLDDVLEGPVKDAGTVASEKKIRIDYQKNGLKVLGNVEQIQRVFSILLDNAIKYGKVNGHIDITAGGENGQVYVEVKDDGIGISNTEISKIFDRFYRADSSRTNNSVPGYGLGLSIAKKVMDQLGGSISVNSEIGKWTVFQLKFRAPQIN